MGEEHYFTEQPAVRSQPGTVDLVLPDLHLRLRTDRGMFSPDRVDPGTRTLLEAVPDPPSRGNLLDLGCGYGPIALTMAARSPRATVWAVDVNKRALKIGQINTKTAGLDNVRFMLGEQVDPEVKFAAIWSNPPIHVGKQVLHAMLAGWLARLAPGGRAHLVVHRHLGSDSLQRWLNGHGWPTRRVTSRNGYRVLAIEPKVAA